MNRKAFLARTALGVGAGAFLATGCAGGSSQKEEASPTFDPNRRYKWNMVTTWPPNFPVVGEGCKLWAEWVESMSGGRLQIRVFGGGELIPALEVFDAVSSGTAQLGHGAAYYWAGKIPAAQFFGSVPFGLNAQQMNAWILAGGGMDLWRELYEPFNLVPFVAGNTMTQMGGWFNREINTIEDLKGLKMRIPGLGGRVFKRAGGSAVLSAGSEIYTNLERGVIDATEWIGPFHDYQMGFHQIADYYYSPGWQEAGTTLELMVNKDNFEGLPLDLQIIIETACARLNQFIMTNMEVKNATYLETMRDEGVDIRTFPQPVLEFLKATTEEVIQELVAEDPKCAKVFASFQDFKATNRPWSSITEKVFYNNF